MVRNVLRLEPCCKCSVSCEDSWRCHIITIADLETKKQAVSGGIVVGHQSSRKKGMTRHEGPNEHEMEFSLG